jgi:hypothetical protein
MKLQLTCPACNANTDAGVKVAKGRVGEPPPDNPPVQLAMCAYCAAIAVVERPETGKPYLRSLTLIEGAQLITAAPELADVLRRAEQGLRDEGLGDRSKRKS